MFPPHGEAPLTVKCTDTTLDYAEKRYWNFGDGTSGSDKSMEHRFDEPGDYNVTLTVWGAGDCFGSKSQTIHVLKRVDSPYDFSGLPRRGVAPLCTSYKVTGRIQQSELEFGDGQKTNERNPFHCYDTAGIYSPVLHACDSFQDAKMSKNLDILLQSPILSEYHSPSGMESGVGSGNP
jgi:PKD repeat protein